MLAIYLGCFVFTSSDEVSPVCRELKVVYDGLKLMCLDAVEIFSCLPPVSISADELGSTSLP